MITCKPHLRNKLVLMCSFCSFQSLSRKDLLKHLKESHINDAGFQIKCLFCGRTFKVYSSFTSHISCSHPSVSTEDAYDCQPVERLMPLSREMVSIIDSPNQLTSATIESTSNDRQMAVTLPTIQMTAAKFLIELKKKYIVSQLVADLFLICQ